jgi:hypothetical protein
MDVCLLSVVCCQVEVSATSWSLVQRSPTDCGASLCVIKKPREGGLGCRAREKNNTLHERTCTFMIITCYTPWDLRSSGKTGCPETSANAIIRCVTSQKSGDLIYTAMKAWNYTFHAPPPPSYVLRALLVPYQLSLSFQNCVFPWYLPTTILDEFLSSPHACHMAHQSVQLNRRENLSQHIMGSKLNPEMHNFGFAVPWGKHTDRWGVSLRIW